jgi:hypothetical protein
MQQHDNVGNCVSIRQTYDKVTDVSPGMRREDLSPMSIVAGHRKFWDRMRHRLEKHPVVHLAGLYLICIAVFLIAIPLPRVDGQLIGSDGTYYYAYLPTLLIDHDLDFTNQYAKLQSPSPAGSHPIPKIGEFPNRYAIGSAVLWMPFFLIGHLMAIILKAAGLSIVLDGMGYIYQIPTLLGSLTYGFIGILLVYRSCRRFYSASASASACILIWLSTSLIYYMIAEPSMSHTCSFFALALFCELWLQSRPLPTFRQWILLGMAGGLVALVRLQDATWLALPCINALLGLRADRKSRLSSQLKGFFGFAVAALIVLMPQMAVWQVLNGAAVKVGYPYSGDYFHWFAPQFLNVLFSLRHGLYLWHPVLLLATAGLVLLYRKDRLAPFLLGLMFIVQVYVIGAWFVWWGGDAFGGRMLISSLPALALGLAALVEWTIERNALPTFGILSCCLILWNAMFFAQYRLGYISQSTAITFKQLTIGKLFMLKDMANHFQKLLR